MAFQVLLGSFDVDSVSSLHESHGLVYKVLRDARLYSDVARMEVHVASLDALDAHGPQSCEVLSQTH